MRDVCDLAQYLQLIMKYDMYFLVRYSLFLNQSGVRDSLGASPVKLDRERK